MVTFWLSPPNSAPSVIATLERISTPRRLHRSARIPVGSSSSGTIAEYAAAITPTAAASKPSSVMNSFSTDTQSMKPCRNTAACSGRSRRRSASAAGSGERIGRVSVMQAQCRTGPCVTAARVRRPAPPTPSRRSASQPSRPPITAAGPVTATPSPRHGRRRNAASSRSRPVSGSPPGAGRSPTARTVARICSR